MNERINQFIKQSYVTTQSPSREEHTYFSREKFAESIVKECLAKVHEELDTDISEAGHAVLNERIMKHFGVEA